MQFKRNRRMLLAQDIVLVCLLPILCFLTLGSLTLGGWSMGDTVTMDLTSSEMSAECLDDFYATYENADRDEMGDTVSFSPLGIWKAWGQGVSGLVNGLINREVTLNNFKGMENGVFDQCADMLFMTHTVSFALSGTLFGGLLYAALFMTMALIPLIVGVQSLRALFYLLARLKEGRERHRFVVLCFRKAMVPLFAVLMFALMLPEVTPSLVWVYGMGLYLVCVLWNFIASRVKRNTGNEKEFLNFIQFFSLGGVVAAAGLVVSLDLSRILPGLYSCVYRAGGLEIIADCIGGNVNISKLLMLGVVAMFLAGVGFTVRYLYYGLLRVACLLESTRHKNVKREGLITSAVFVLLGLGSAFLLFYASGKPMLVLGDTEMTLFYVALGLAGAVLILEIVQRILCSVNRLDREYRNDLLCGCTEDRVYSVDAVIAEAPVEETPAEKTPAEETPAEETPVEETPVEETPAEETPAEETPVEETPAEETVTEDSDK